MNHFPRSLIGAAIASILAAPTVSWAQSADATLRGSAPASADVTAKNVNTGVTRRTKASADGTYTLAGMPPGTYRVDAGPGTETVVTLTVASTATLDLAPSAGEVAEAPMQEVTVTGRRLTEVRTSEVGATVSAQQIASVPQMTRSSPRCASVSTSRRYRGSIPAWCTPMPDRTRRDSVLPNPVVKRNPPIASAMASRCSLVVTRTLASACARSTAAACEKWTMYTGASRRSSRASSTSCTGRRSYE